jgi:SnoaL-like domain
MPWAPELFSAPALERLRERRRREHLTAVPYFDGLITGELGALVGSFAAEPELHHPRRGRIKGAPAFGQLVTDTRTWLDERNVAVEDINFIVMPRGGVEEVVLRIDGDNGRIELPLALTADRNEDGLIIEIRIYFSTWPLTGRHAIRPPLLQPSGDVHEPDIVGDYQRALAAGDIDAAVAAFEPDGYVREPAGDAYIHRGTEQLRTLYELFFSNGGGIPLEHCGVFDDGRACALEYNVVSWGRTELPPQAGIAVYVRGDSGKLSAARIYDDSDPPLSQQA